MRYLLYDNETLPIFALWRGRFVHTRAIVLLFNGFQKKSQKTPRKEIEQAKKLKIEYYAEKGK